MTVIVTLIIIFYLNLMFCFIYIEMHEINFKTSENINCCKFCIVYLHFPYLTYECSLK